jgi:uncharacterized membrane protein YhaH (DUF805 family)
MNFVDSIKAYWRNYANFHGRTSKKTFWWTVLFLALAGSVVAVLFPGAVEVVTIGDMTFPSRSDSAMQTVWSIGTFLPSIARGVRRLQDIGKPGTYIWFALLPIAGAIMLLIWFLKPGELTANKDGEPVI